MKNLKIINLVGIMLVLAIAILPITSASIISNTFYGLLSFMGIIKITNANHLSHERIPISDIYPEVKSLDGIWSETIPAGDYVRITFQKNLKNKNDITIYPKIISGNPTIDVYEKDKTTKIAEFSNLTSGEYNKVVLTNLSDSQRSFDLHVLGGSIQIDQIIDPAPITNLSSPANGTTSSDFNQTFISNESSDTQLNNASLYIWNSTGNLLQSGVSMWTANYTSNGVTKVLPNGTGFRYYGTGRGPKGIAFDGTNMWTSNLLDNTVTKVLPNGTMFNYSGTGSQPTAIAFDGTNMWTVNINDNTVTKVLPNGTMFNYSIAGISPDAIAFDGTNMWVSDFYIGVFKILQNGTSFTYSGGSNPHGIAFDGTNMWVSNSGNNSVSKVLSNGTFINYYGTGPSPYAIAFDGTNMWTANNNGPFWTVTKIFPNGTMVNYTGTTQNPYSIAFDGTNMWSSNVIGGISKILPNGTIINYNIGNFNYVLAFDGATLIPTFTPAFPKTTSISGTSNSTSWNYNFSSYGTYFWNVNTCDTSGSCAFNSTNYTITINPLHCWSYDSTVKLLYIPTGCAYYLQGTGAYV